MIDVVGCYDFREVSSLTNSGIDEAMNSIISAGLSPQAKKKKKRFYLFGKR